MNLTGFPRASVNIQAIPIRNNRRLAKPRTQLWSNVCYVVVSDKGEEEITSTSSLLLELNTKQQASRLLRRQTANPVDIV